VKRNCDGAKAVPYVPYCYRNIFLSIYIYIYAYICMSFYKLKLNKISTYQLSKSTVCLYLYRYIEIRLL